MENEEFELLVAILKSATKQLVDMLLQRFADAAKRAWSAIRRAAQCAFAWVCNACEHAGAYLRDALSAGWGPWRGRGNGVLRCPRRTTAPLLDFITQSGLPKIEHVIF